MNHLPLVIVAAGAGLWSVPATSQDLNIGLEATTNEVRRGLSWSENRVSVSGDATVTSGPFETSARVSTLRNSSRHAGSDAVLDLSVGHRWEFDAFRLRADATGHLFIGARQHMDYAELGLSASHIYGPLELSAGAVLAPLQATIGGSNLYLYIDALSGIPG